MRPSLFGDIICSLPCLYVWEKLYPGSYKTICISPKCTQVVPLLLNHPLIDRIYITEHHDQWGPKDIDIAHKHNIVLELNPPVTNEFWYNHHSIHEEQFLMSINLTDQCRYSEIHWNLLTEREKKPYLEKWFSVEKCSKTIALWAECGYANQDSTIRQRSPSINFWANLVADLNKLGFAVNCYGHPNSNLVPFAVDRRNLSLFDAVKESLGCDLCIGTDSGSSHILGAYGAKQVILYTNWRHNHTFNLSALCPVNYCDNAIYIFQEQDLDFTPRQKIVDAILKFV